MATGAECEGYSLIQSGFAVKPNGSCINYIWNSVVFLFNTLLKKKKKRKKGGEGREKSNSERAQGCIIFTLNVRLTSHSILRFSIYSFLTRRPRDSKGTRGGLKGHI